MRARIKDDQPSLRILDAPLVAHSENAKKRREP